MASHLVCHYRERDVVEEVRRLTRGGADVAIEALGTRGTLRHRLRCLRPGGTLSGLGACSGKLQILV